MNAVLDAGALVAIDRRDRLIGAQLALQLRATPLRVSSAVVAKAWRDGRRQATLARVLAGVGREALAKDDGNRIGEPLARFPPLRTRHRPLPAEMARDLDVHGLPGLLAGVPLWVMVCHCEPRYSAGYGRMADGIGPEPAVRRTACSSGFSSCPRPADGSAGLREEHWWHPVLACASPPMEPCLETARV